MRAATLFSGIGAPECAAPHLDWLWSAEIEPFPAAVLAARHPQSANLGNVLADDFIDRARAFGPLDLLVGGPPCQAFSVAGLRNSLADPRGNLTLRWVQVIHAVRPRVSLTENVPGWLSTKDNAFGCFLGAIVGADDPLCTPDGGSWPDAGMVAGPLMRAAWRILDAQHFGVPQRRRRVFVVASAGDGIDPASVLFEPASLRWNPPPGGKTGERLASTIEASLGRRCGQPNDHDPAGGLVAAFGGNNTAGPVDVATACNAHGGPHGRLDFESETFVTHPLRADGFDASEDGTGRGTPLVPVACIKGAAIGREPHNGPQYGEVLTDGTSFTLNCVDRHAVAFSCKDSGLDAGSIAPTLRAMPHDGSHANAGGQVAVALDTMSTTRYHATHADANQADTVALLRALREAVGAEAFEEWGLGVLASLWPQEILRPALHGVGFRCPPIAKSGLVNCALAFAKGCPEGAVRALWSAGCDGRPSPRWQPSEQLARELGAALSELPYAPSSACRFMSYLRQADEGSRLVRQALSAVEEARRSAASKTEPAHGSAQVRRLTVEECEALQGFPRTFTAISYRGKPAADGPRYRALGNSMAVPCIRWILERVELADAAMLPERAAA